MVNCIANHVLSMVKQVQLNFNYSLASFTTINHRWSLLIVVIHNQPRLTKSTIVKHIQATLTKTKDGKPWLIEANHNQPWPAKLNIIKHG